jgi:NADPH2:quinone reductase
MRVVRVTRFGGPDVLVTTEAPSPVARPGHAVVDVLVADVLLVDAVIRRGLGVDYFPVRPPYIPGNGVAGRVSSVGESVDPGWIGERVVAHTGGRGGEGGYAEQLAAPVDALIPVPDGLGLCDATALLHDGLTAMCLVEGLPVAREQWVLVVGAAGGLGSLLVQLAHAAGGRIIGAARGKQKLDLAWELGAEAVADYSEPGWPERVRKATGGRGPDLVFDGIGGEVGHAAFEITARGGRFSAHGAASGSFAELDLDEARRHGVTVRGIEQVQVGPAESRRLTERALSEATAGRIRPVIGQTFPLEEAAAAHAAIESRSVIGKTLLLVASPGGELK